MSQSLYLPRAHNDARIISVGGLSHKSPINSVTNFLISLVQSPHEKVSVTAAVVPKVTCDLPHYHIPFDSGWSHLSDLELADAEFGTPGPIDLLLSVDVFVVLLHGRRVGPTNTPVAIETKFGWIIAGTVDTVNSTEVVSNHTTTMSEDISKRFWEIEEIHQADSGCWSMEERTVVKHFEAQNFLVDVS